MAPPSTTTITTPAAPTTGTMTTITIDLDGDEVQRHLSDNATARSIAGQLPVTLSFGDYGGQE